MLAAEIGLLDLGAGEIGLQQIVFGQKVGVLKAQALFHAAGIGVGLDAEGHDAERADRVPDGQGLVVAHVQFPALFADIGDAQGGDRNAGDLDPFQRGEGEVVMVERFGVGDQLLQRRPRVRPPKTDGGVGFGHVGDGDVKALVGGDTLHEGEVARAGIGAVDHPAAVGHADDGQVGAHAAVFFQKMGVDAAADIALAADACGAQPLHQGDMIGALDIADGEMRQVHHADIVAHLQMLGVGDAPEVAIVPLVRAHWHLVGPLFQQVLVCGIAMGALPAAQLHEVAAHFHLARVKGRAAHVAALGEGLARVNGGIVDLACRFGAAVVDILLFDLMRLEAGIVGAVNVDMGAPVGHPVGDQLADARRVLDPDGDGVPQAAHCLRFAQAGAAIGRRLQQAVEGALFVIAEFAQDRRQFDRLFKRPYDLLHVEVTLGGGQARLTLFEDVARVDEARRAFLVIAPFDHAALGRFRIARVAHIGRIALIA